MALLFLSMQQSAFGKPPKSAMTPNPSRHKPRYRSLDHYEEIAYGQKEAHKVAQREAWEEACVVGRLAISRAASTPTSNLLGMASSRMRLSRCLVPKCHGLGFE